MVGGRYTSQRGSTANRLITSRAATAFCSWTGAALEKKTPLLRSCEAALDDDHGVHFATDTDAVCLVEYSREHFALEGSSARLTLDYDLAFTPQLGRTRLNRRFRERLPGVFLVECKWAVDDAPDGYLDGMVKAIVGVEVRVTEVGATRKLSQNRAEDDRLGAIEGLSQSPDPSAQALAERMADPRLQG